MKKNKQKIAQIELLMEWLFANYDIRINGYKQIPEIKSKSESEYQEMTDILLNNIRMQALIQGFGKSTVTELMTIIKSSYVPTVFELKDYFEQLEALPHEAYIEQEHWHTPTIKQYFDTLQLAHPENSFDLYRLFQRYIVACVNSALQVKHNDVMLLLVGPQGIYKTSWLEHIIPAEFKEKYLYSGHIEPSLTNRETANYLAEKWFVNIDDQLEVIFGKEYNSMKAIISANQITSRRVYALFDTTRKRIANFMGSVNSVDFLTDYQNRRYFIIEVEKISENYTEVNMAMFWREALYIAQATNPYHIFTKQQYELINDMSREYRITTHEEVLLTQLFSPYPKEPEHDYEMHLLTSEIYHILQKNTTYKISMRNLSNALKKLSFQAKTKRLTRYGNEPRRIWVVYTDYSKIPEDLRQLQTEDTPF